MEPVSWDRSRSSDPKGYSSLKSKSSPWKAKNLGKVWFFTIGRVRLDKKWWKVPSNKVNVSPSSNAFLVNFKVTLSKRCPTEVKKYIKIAKLASRSAPMAPAVAIKIGSDKSLKEFLVVVIIFLFKRKRKRSLGVFEKGLILLYKPRFMGETDLYLTILRSLFGRFLEGLSLRKNFILLKVSP